MTKQTVFLAIIFLLYNGTAEVPQSQSQRTNYKMAVSAQSVSKTPTSWLNHPIVRRAREHYVSVEVKDPKDGKRSATGIILKQNLVLTNIHLIIRWEAIHADESPNGMLSPDDLDSDTNNYYTEKDLLDNFEIFVNGKRAKVIAKDLGKDLLLLRVPTKKIQLIQMRRMIEIEEPVFYIGNPSDRGKGFTSSGTILAAGKHAIRSNIYFRPGSSGSGLYSFIDGKLLGINSEYSCEDDDEDCRRSLTRRVVDIKRFLKKSGVSLR